MNEIHSKSNAVIIWRISAHITGTVTSVLIIHTCTATVLRHYGLFCIGWQADPMCEVCRLLSLSAHFTHGISLPSEDRSDACHQSVIPYRDSITRFMTHRVHTRSSKEVEELPISRQEMRSYSISSSWCSSQHITTRITIPDPGD